MPGFDMLDTAIGVTFFFLLLSLIVTATSEMLEALWRARATTLADGIRSLFQGDLKMTRAFFEHPMIQALVRPHDRNSAAPSAAPETGKPTDEVAWWKETRQNKRLPSYIPAPTFAKVLLDLLLGGAPGTSVKAGPSGRHAAEVSVDSARLLQELSLISAVPSRLNDARIPPELAAALQPVFTDVKADVATVRAALEQWYDASMDRVSGWYKRHALLVAFLLGLGVAVFLNADTLAVVKALSSNKALREGLIKKVEAYQEVVANAPPPPVVNHTMGANPDAQAHLKAAQDSLTHAVTRLEATGLPIGWGPDNARYNPFRSHPFPSWGFLWAFLLKLLGLLLTGVALSLGAPFWFDVLNRFMVVRSTVKDAEKRGPQASKEPQKNEQGKAQQAEETPGARTLKAFSATSLSPSSETPVRLFSAKQYPEDSPGTDAAAMAWRIVQRLFSRWITPEQDITNHTGNAGIRANMRHRLNTDYASWLRDAGWRWTNVTDAELEKIETAGALRACCEAHLTPLADRNG